MSSIRQDIERERELRKQRQPKRLYQADGLRAKEVTGSRVIYCESCKGPVVDSVRTREMHADEFPKCRRAMESQDK